MTQDQSTGEAQAAPAKGVNGLGVAALVVGVLAVLCAFIPVLGCIGWPLAVVGAILGGAGLFIGDKGRKLPVAGLVVSLAAFPIYFLATGVAVEAGRQAEAARQQAIVDAQPEMSVSATQLRSDYDANEVRADSTYKNKVVLVEGLVDEVARDLVDTAYVTLRAGNAVFNVQCYFEEEQAKGLTGLRSGQPVQIKGRVDGLFGNVMVKECVLVEKLN